MSTKPKHDLKKYKNKWLPWEQVKSAIEHVTDIRKWMWAYNQDCKYITLKIDSRTGNTLIINEKNESISIEQLLHQRVKSGKEYPEAIDYQKELYDYFIGEVKEEKKNNRH